jgi:hypothetical protein
MGPAANVVNGGLPGPFGARADVHVVAEAHLRHGKRPEARRPAPCASQLVRAAWRTHSRLNDATIVA